MANFTRVKPAGWSLNEILTSAQQNALDIDHVKAINGDDGSSHSPTAQIDIGGLGLKLSNNQKLGYNSRLVPRVMPWVGDEPNWTTANFNLQVTGGASYFLQQTASGNIYVEAVDLPHNGVLDGFTIHYKGQTGHANDPVTTGITMPSIQVYKCAISSSTGSTVGARTYDDKTVRATYEAAHTWALSGLAETIDRTAYRYGLRIWSESGSDYRGGAIFYGIIPNVYVTEQSEY